MAARDEADEADALADLANTMAICRLEPARFHEIRNELAVRARGMAKRLRAADGAVKASTTWRAPNVRR
jgi:hypothetical protein